MINESLQRNDLDGVLSSNITIDEYNGKLQDDSIVVAFKLDDDGAAADLAFYIEKLPVNILDSEVMDTIDIRGKYTVLVEFRRNAFFKLKLFKLLRLVMNVCSIKEWTFSVDGKHTKYSINSTNINKYVRLTKKVISLEESVNGFFKNSTVSDYSLTGDILTITNNNSTVKFVLECINEQDAKQLRENMNLHESFWGSSKLSQWMGGIECLSIEGGITLLENNNIIFKAYRL